jgi:DNA-binding response OmpR family regulator
LINRRRRFAAGPHPLSPPPLEIHGVFLRSVGDAIERVANHDPTSSIDQRAVRLRAVPLIAIVDDEEDVLLALRALFEANGFEVASASDGEAGLALAARADVIVSDVNMPALDGFSLCRKLRASGSTVPIILLTSRDSDIDEALGLELGADDYIGKPYSPRVLVARVCALLRRTQPAGAPALVRGPISFDADALRIRVRDRTLETTVTEYRLLEALARRPGVVFSRERLIELAREDDSVVAPRIVDTYVARLRRKIGEVAPGLDPIETVIGAGYRFRDG